LKLELPASFPRKAIVPAVFAATGLLCFVLSIWTASAIERFSRLGVRRALVEAGHTWTGVEADGLQVILTGTAPTEAMRFRALSVAGNVVDATRLRDAMSVADDAGIAAPDFSIQILRNDDGISLIGLAPTSMDRDALVSSLDKLADKDQVTDMLESADHPAPPGWEDEVSYALTALKTLPRAKISLSAGKLEITAISDSPAQKAQFETALRRKAPKGMQLILNISAPHPVITPFTLRFLMDDQGARFDACSADSDAARRRIIAAATDVGAVNPDCTVGLGVPTPVWADAVVMALKAMKTLGHGSLTFSDADIALVADADVPQADFDRVVGELESNLPDVFSLRAIHTPKSQGTQAAAVAEFTATLTPDGRVDLSGRLADDLSRQAIESFAKSRFGSDSVHTATRLAPDMPPGWPTRVLVALEALGELQSGKVVVRAGDLKISGTTGSQDTRATVARILSSKLGESGKYDIAITYDKKLDPLLGLPTDQECVTQVNDILNASKITFEPGSAIIDPSAKDTLDKIAAVLKNCTDYPMEVGGHTDAQGREEMNLALSDQRAKAVIVALQSRRILTSNLTAKGYGETVPLEPNNTEAGREKNRRIEFRLLTPGISTDGTGGDDMAADGSVTDSAGTDAEGSDGTEVAAVTVQIPDDNTVRPKPRPDDLKTN
jgi:OOP family OmpA-OmpF porin